MTPNTAPYFHAAYTVAAVVYGLYIVSLLRRSRTVKERLRSRESASRASRASSRD